MVHDSYSKFWVFSFGTLKDNNCFWHEFLLLYVFVSWDQMSEVTGKWHLWCVHIETNVKGLQRLESHKKTAWLINALLLVLSVMGYIELKFFYIQYVSIS